MGKVGIVAACAFVGLACGRGAQTSSNQNQNVGVDAGPPTDVDAGSGSSADGGTGSGGGGTGSGGGGGQDAGTPADGGTSGGGVAFSGPGPWPIANVTYGAADGIQEVPVVGVSTDETQNLWVATNAALYLMKPGEKKFTRFDASAGLHLPGNPAAACDDSQGTLRPCPAGDADAPGISEIVGGGPNEVFVGYYGHHDWSRPDDGTWTDPWRHSGKLDRVRLQASGALEVVRMDMVSNNSVEFWHNKSVWKMVYDHFIHPHELYVGTDHGVDKISPDKWKPSKGWFLSPDNQQVWMSDHLHPQTCYHMQCGSGESGLRLGDWRGLAIDREGDLWVGGRWAAGAITYVEDNVVWYNRGGKSYKQAFGDPYFGNCSGSRPVFCVPQEGDFVSITAVTVTKDDTVWFSSGVVYGEAGETNYGIASFNGHTFAYFDPMRDAGMVEMNVKDMIALPDGRLVLAGPNSGLTFWDPAKGTHTSIRGGQGIPSDQVMRLQLDTMVDPPALQVATAGGAAVLRVLPK